MNFALERSKEELGPWNPGIGSSIPRRLLPVSTIFCTENVFTTVQRATELQALTGLDLSELVVFRPERLVLHEVLIRVTSDLSVPDGSKYEDLGINFRQMVSVIMDRHIQPRMSEFVTAYDAARHQIAAATEAEIAAIRSRPDSQPTKSEQLRLFGLRWGGQGKRDGLSMAPQMSLPDLVEHWLSRAEGEGNALTKAVLLALARIAYGFYRTNGHSRLSSDLLAEIAVDLASNSFCSHEIGRLITPYISNAVRSEGYRYLPSQRYPIVLNTKGPSASGKSSLRPFQRSFVGTIGASWEDFALISPDIWRKQLLDYASLGADFRYGAMLTGDEIAIIDNKLDHFMAHAAEQGRVPHLLIDRFRFGSFTTKSEGALNNLLSRFGQKIYFYFMITPPEEIVERAWIRGLRHGRYKAVSDLLAHSVEAYSGMPRLFLAWVGRVDKWINYEFLDNNVPLGCRPKTVAFGSNGQLVVLDVKSMLDVERFRRININATAPSHLYEHVDSESESPAANVAFLVQCVRQLREVVFADRATARVYLRIVAQEVVWLDPEALRCALVHVDTAAGILAVAPDAVRKSSSLGTKQQPCYVWDVLGSKEPCTLGEWGGRG